MIWNNDDNNHRDMDEVDENGTPLVAPPPATPPGPRPRSTGKPPAPQNQRRPQAPAPKAPEPEVTYDVEAIESPEEDDFSEVLTDATLRLQQGTLYQMVMNSNLFENMDVDPRAVKNVEREIKRFARERMEIMLGMRQEKQIQQYAQFSAEMVAQSSPFNALEVQVLKQVAAAASKGATERPEADQIAQTIEKRTTLSPISAPKAPAPVAPKPLAQKPAAPIQRAKAPAPAPTFQPARQKPVDPNQIDEVMNGTGKSVAQMTEEERIAHNAAANERQRPRAYNPKAVPQPLGDQLLALHTQKEAQMDAKAANAISTVLTLMNNAKK